MWGGGGDVLSIHIYSIADEDITTPDTEKWRLDMYSLSNRPQQWMK